MKYVSEFEFPSEAGFTGSAQKFARGGKAGHKYNPGSPQFRMKTSKQDPMDYGVQPARKGRSQQDIEAGGTPKLKPKFALGGKAKSSHDEMYKHGGKMGFKKGVQHKYADGGTVYKDSKKAGYRDPADRNRPSNNPNRSQGEQVKATGQHSGKKRLTGQTMRSNRKNTVRGANKSQGESVSPIGRGSVNVGKGGKTGSHKGYKYAHGGRVLSGQTSSNQRRNTVEGTHSGEGQSVSAVGRGQSNVGKGGTVGSHMGYRYAKGGKMKYSHASPYAHGGMVKDTYRTSDPGGYKGAMKGRGKGVV